MRALYHRAAYGVEVHIVGKHLFLFIVTKRCNTCTHFKFFSEFAYDSAQNDDYAGRCKQCKSEERGTPEEKAAKKVYNDAYREANREELQALDRARHNTDTHRAKRRARYAVKSEIQRAEKALEKLNAPPPPPITEKLCPACDPPIPKLVSEFGVDTSRKDKLAPYCKECTQKKAHARLDKRREYEYSRSPEEKQAQEETIRRWHQTHPLAKQGYQLQRLAQKKGVGIIDRVNFAYILERDGMHCYICDKPILSYHILTFDHVIPLVPQRGEPQGSHSEENIRPAHKECNSRKSNRQLEDLTPFDRRGVDY